MNFTNIKDAAAALSKGQQVLIGADQQVENAKYNFNFLKESKEIELADLKTDLEDAEKAVANSAKSGSASATVKKLQTERRDLLRTIKRDLRSAAQAAQNGMRAASLQSRDSEITLLNGQKVDFYTGMVWFCQKIEDLEANTPESDSRIVEIDQEIKRLSASDTSRLDRVEYLKKEIDAVERFIASLDKVAAVEFAG